MVGPAPKPRAGLAARRPELEAVLPPSVPSSGPGWYRGGMRRHRSLLIAALLHATVGCGEPSGGDDGRSSTGSSGSASTGTTSGPSSATSTGDGSGTSSSASSDGPGPGTSTTGPDPSTTDGDGSSDGGGTGPICEPTPPAGDLCLECVHANCCVTWQACMNDEPCACVVDCHVVQGNSLGMCSNACNLDSDLYQALYFCGQASCLGSCDWDCC